MTDDLGSDDATAVVAALRALRTARADETLLGRIEALFVDPRVSSTMLSYGPEYRAVCEEAIAALEAQGPRTLPALLRATKLAHRVTMPDPAYDQGQYIGDYGERTVVVADAALEAIRRVERDHPGSVPWMHMGESAWQSCDDVETLLRAIFERAPHGTLQDHLRRFFAACARASGPLDGELDDAAAVAERAAFEPTTSDVITAARAAAHHARSPAAPLIALALAGTMGREEALEAAAKLGTIASAKRLRELVPMYGLPATPPPPRRRAAWDDLLDAVIANLDDDAPRLAFGAWLSERGDPRGELVALQCAPTLDETGRARERELLSAHAASWSRWADIVLFRRGFADTIVSDATIGDLSLAALRGEPTVRGLVVIGLRGSAWIEVLASAPETNRLRTLALRGLRLQPFDLERLFLSPHFGDLRDVELSDCGVRPEALVTLESWLGMRKVERLLLTGNGLGRETVARLRSALPSLREVSV